MFSRIKVIAAAAAVISGLWMTTVAFAHAPIGTVVWDNPSAPSRVIATSRGQDISTEPGTFYVKVFDPNDNQVDLGNYAVVDPKRMSVGVKQDLNPGTYKVEWKTLSAGDGDEATGTLDLVLTASASAPAPAATTAPAVATPATVSAPATGDGGLLDRQASPWWQTSAAIALAVAGFGGTSLLLLRGRRALIFSSRRRLMFRKLFLGGVVFLSAGLALLGVQLAQAHSRPIRFDPAPGAVLNAAPVQVTGWFTSGMRRDPNWNFIQVTDGQGNRVDTGEPVLSTDRRQMSVALKPGLGNGVYMVTWRTWDDADGEIFGQCFTFFVGQAAADQAVTNKTRLDVGRNCQAIEVSASNRTPVAGTTPQASGTPSADDDDEATAAESSNDNGDSGIPIWGLALGVVVGVVVGGVGGRLVGSKPKA